MADEDTERPRRPRWVSFLRTSGGIVLGIGSAVLVARLMGLRWSEVAVSLRNAHPLPLLAAVSGTFGLLALQALRWWWVVRPVLPLRYRDAFAAMLVASAFNVLIPARGGDVIRVQYLGKRTGTSRVTLLGTELLDYWSDKAGWILAFLLTCVVSAVGWREGPPTWLVHAIGILALLVLGSGGLAVIAQLPLLSRILPRLDPGPRWLQKLRSGFAAHDRRSLLVVEILLAPLPWLWEVPVVMIAGHAVGLSLSPMVAFALITAANLGTVVPVPGGAGSFEAAGAYALASAGVRHDVAFAFVLIYHLSLLLPMVVAGGGLVALQGRSLLPRRLATRLRRGRRGSLLEPGGPRP